MEFESLRDYVESDEVRRIDSAATARRGRPFTRLFRHERNRTVLVALDASRLMGSLVDGRTKLDHAIDAALALAYGAITAGDRIGMLVFDGAVRALLEPGPRRHLGAFVDLLRTVEPRLVEADYMTLAQALGGGRRQRALVIVLTDFVDADPAAVLHPLALLARRHRVLFVAVRDRAYGGLVPRAPKPLDLYRRRARRAARRPRAHPRPAPPRRARDPRPRARAHHDRRTQSLPDDAADRRGMSSASHRHPPRRGARAGGPASPTSSAVAYTAATAKRVPVERRIAHEALGRGRDRQERNGAADEHERRHGRLAHGIGARRRLASRPRPQDRPRRTE
jgi:hypothetical protein